MAASAYVGSFGTNPHGSESSAHGIKEGELSAIPWVLLLGEPFCKPMEECDS